MSNVCKSSWGETRYSLTKGVTMEWAEMGLVVFVPRTGEYWFGNVTGGEVLVELSGGLATASVCDRLASSYGISIEQASSDVVAIIEELLVHSVIEVAC